MTSLSFVPVIGNPFGSTTDNPSGPSTKGRASRRRHILLPARSAAQSDVSAAQTRARDIRFCVDPGSQTPAFDC